MRRLRTQPRRLLATTRRSRVSSTPRAARAPTGMDFGSVDFSGRSDLMSADTLNARTNANRVHTAVRLQRVHDVILGECELCTKRVPSAAQSRYSDASIKRSMRECQKLAWLFENRGQYAEDIWRAVMMQFDHRGRRKDLMSCIHNDATGGKRYPVRGRDPGRNVGLHVDGRRAGLGVKPALFRRLRYYGIRFRRCPRGRRPESLQEYFVSKRGPFDITRDHV